MMSPHSLAEVVLHRLAATAVSNTILVGETQKRTLRRAATEMSRILWLSSPVVWG
jgi:hypothetical protein